MRQFYIEDDVGHRIDLNGHGGTGIFLSRVTGLGMTIKSSFLGLQQGFFQPTATTDSQSNLVGDLTFMGANPYEAYRTFADWVNGAKELFIIYKPYGATEFFRKVKLNYLTKTELTAGKWLTVPCSFACLTPWYRELPAVMSIAKEQENVLRYAFSYTEDLSYSSGRGGTFSAELHADGHIPAAFVFSFKGALTNPVINLGTGSLAQSLGRCEIADSFAATDTLELSTQYGNAYVRKISESGVETDLLDKINLSYEPFPRVPLGVDCFLSLTADNAISGSGTVKTYCYYRSV